MAVVLLDQSLKLQHMSMQTPTILKKITEYR